jgi:prefoldin subunit 5
VQNQVGQTMHTILAQVTKEVKDCKIEMYQAELECIKRQYKDLNDQQRALTDQKTTLDNREKFVKDKLNVLFPLAYLSLFSSS